MYINRWVRLSIAIFHVKNEIKGRKEGRKDNNLNERKKERT